MQYNIIKLEMHLHACQRVHLEMLTYQLNHRSIAALTNDYSQGTGSSFSLKKLYIKNRFLVTTNARRCGLIADLFVRCRSSSIYMIVPRSVSGKKIQMF